MLVSKTVHLFGPPGIRPLVYEWPAVLEASFCPGQPSPYVLSAQISVSHIVEIQLTAAQKTALFRAWRAPRYPQNQADKEPEPVQREA